MGLYVKGGTWKNWSTFRVKTNSGWQNVKKGFIRSVSGWVQFFPTALIPDNEVTISQSTGSDYLVTLTGTNYHWSSSSTPTLTYDILWSSDNTNWISVFTRTAPNGRSGPNSISNPASKSQNTITYKILNNSGLIIPDIQNYFAFVVYANTSNEFGISQSSSIIVQGPGTPVFGTPTHDVSGTHIPITGSNDLSFAIFASNTSGGENTSGTPYTIISGSTLNLTSLTNAAYLVAIGYTGTNRAGYPSNTSYEVYTKNGLRPSAPTISNIVKNYVDYSLQVSFDTSTTDYVIYQDNSNPPVTIRSTPYTYGTPKGGEFAAGATVSYTATSYNASYGAGDSTSGSFALNPYPLADYSISFSNIQTDSYTVTATLGINTNQVIYYDNSVNDSYTFTTSGSTTMPGRGHVYTPANPGPTVNWSAVGTGPIATPVTKYGSFNLTSFIAPVPNPPSLTLINVYQDSFVVRGSFDSTAQYATWSTSAGTSGTSYTSPFTIDNGRNLGVPGGPWSVSATAVNSYGKTASSSLSGTYLPATPANYPSISISPSSTSVTINISHDSTVSYVVYSDTSGAYIDTRYSSSYTTPRGGELLPGSTFSYSWTAYGVGYYSQVSGSGTWSTTAAATTAATTAAPPYFAPPSFPYFPYFRGATTAATTAAPPYFPYFPYFRGATTASPTTAAPPYFPYFRSATPAATTAAPTTKAPPIAPYFPYFRGGPYFPYFKPATTAAPTTAAPPYFAPPAFGGGGGGRY